MFFLPVTLFFPAFWSTSADSFGGGFVVHEKSKFRRQRFEGQLLTEGLRLNGFGSSAVAHARLDVHLHILERCQANHATYCLIMEDFVHWKPGELIKTIKEALLLPRFDVAVLGRNENQIRCDDIEATFDHFSRLTCSPFFNYAVLVHHQYYSNMLNLLQEDSSEVCGYHTDVYFATERLYRVPSNALWYIASPLPVQLRSHLMRSKGHFAARCALGLHSTRPIVMLHPMRTGGTSVCDMAAEWYLMGGRGGGGLVQNCRVDDTSGGGSEWRDLSAREVQGLYSKGVGFVAMEPSFTAWDDGQLSEAPYNGSEQRYRWYAALSSTGFWGSYLTVLLVRDPVERYLSWLRFCQPTCIANLSGDPRAFTSTHPDCIGGPLSKFIQLLFQHRISRSELDMLSPLRFDHGERIFTAGCRGYHKGYHLAQASNCLTRHLLHLRSAPTDSDLKTALDLVERFEVVMDLAVAPNESSALLQDAFRRNMNCGDHCELLNSLADLMMPHSHNTRSKEPFAKALSDRARELLEEHNLIDRAVVSRAHQLIQQRYSRLLSAQGIKAERSIVAVVVLVHEIRTPNIPNFEHFQNTRWNQWNLVFWYFWCLLFCKAVLFLSYVFPWHRWGLGTFARRSRASWVVECCRASISFYLVILVHGWLPGSSLNSDVFWLLSLPRSTWWCQCFARLCACLQWADSRFADSEINLATSRHRRPAHLAAAPFSQEKTDWRQEDRQNVGNESFGANMRKSCRSEYNDPQRSCDEVDEGKFMVIHRPFSICFNSPTLRKGSRHVCLPFLLQVTSFQNLWPCDWREPHSCEALFPHVLKGMWEVKSPKNIQKDIWHTMIYKDFFHYDPIMIPFNDANIC